MADLQNENDEAVLFNAANQPVVSHAVTPESGEIHAKRLAELPWVSRTGDTLAQVAQYFLLRFGVELAEFASGAVVELDGPQRFGSRTSHF
jgi:hypothetical protein